MKTNDRGERMYDDYDDDDFRNARRRVRRPVGRPIGAVVGPRPMAPPSYGYPAPWAPPPAAPVVDRFTGGLKLGMILDAAAQALAAMSGLPAAPTATGEGKVDTHNLLKYQEALAQHAKRDEQIRTVGALARLFLV
jgi:hypothetical protein